MTFPLQHSCWYCERNGVTRLAVATVHDRRGCVHVCPSHGTWRMTTSFAFGHHPDCAMVRAGDVK